MNTSTIEQFVVTKGGTSLIFGSQFQGFSWSTITSDFLLSKIISSARYQRVLCLVFDSSSNRIEKICQGRSDKLKLFENESNLETLTESIQYELESTNNINNNDENKIEKSDIAVVIYSFSEMILKYGITKSFHFINEIEKLLKMKTTEKYSLILTIHISLHSPRLLSRIQTLGNINIIVKPNQGTLSHEVITEIHCIRRSIDSGKVNEDIDLFSIDSSNNLICIAPIPRKQIIIKENNEEKVIDNPISKFQQSIVDNINKTNSNINQSNGMNSMITKQLITFDSTDPEFDDDEDPDDDLDL